MLYCSLLPLKTRCTFQKSLLLLFFLFHRQRQHISQLEQKVRESELQVRSALLGCPAPYGDAYMLRMQVIGCNRVSVRNVLNPMALPLLIRSFLSRRAMQSKIYPLCGVPITCQL